ncbi:MAG: transcription antitermination factor NusB [Gammaproteobacteria bacterium]|nr:transcription antitermination factor NusB [Gammaproteobacteria bacterium]MYH84330.1 transcription antitermination factor NusB [Gammaproteobacteria bacterium]MYK04302.1 transcription antitermination factor NusB [Gammaproteobacteria bacterium]
MTSPRNRARRLALQALYQWIMSENDPREIAKQLREDADGRIDLDYFDRLFPAISESRNELQQHLEPVLDGRRLDPVEQAVIWLGTFELAGQSDVPYRVVIDESVELAKVFGATDSYKYVNAVLDNLAPRLRGDEAAAG